jgi:hypothetical protein
MTLYQPPTASSNSIVSPPCPKCGANMLLTRIEPDAPGYDRRTFECSACTHSMTMAIKVKPWLG